MITLHPRLAIRRWERRSFGQSSWRWPVDDYGVLHRGSRAAARRAPLLLPRKHGGGDWSRKLIRVALSSAVGEGLAAVLVQSRS